MIRKEILHFINNPVISFGEIDKLKASISLKNDSPSNLDDLEDWLMSCIKSLFYRTNDKVLVIIGKDIDKQSTLIYYLCPKIEWFGCDCIDENYYKYIYEKFIVDASDLSPNYLANYSKSDGFKIDQDKNGKISIDKRLCNICYYWPEGSMPSSFSSKKYVKLFVSNIDINILNSVDRRSLWSELWIKLLTKYSIAGIGYDEIEEYFK